ncbi:hypothetical protein M2139_001501 [Enterococcus sp. PF1-24]|uniref:DUF5415 family protein n=1 Tax=unclassified Enterococcus TaxID=2608891 RepID=UPI002476CC8B|nr:MULTISPECIES: DUF5415 family protein [unclassified Enterococcus]MDH6364508.1 hypothetical protein [Enterococcus sp. PFB1-1]MDH6401615.1 hypothetical protein [Enterococcus sp. PF1-24]
MAGKKVSLSPLESASKKILEKKGKNFDEWKKKKIYDRQMLVLQGLDKKWQEQVIQDEMNQLVLEELSKSGGNPN